MGPRESGDNRLRESWAGRITSDGGVMLLAQAERRLGIAERLAQVIPDRRDRDRVIHLLPDSDLRDARLGGAFLVGASLRGADLRGAYLRLARLDGADLSDADFGVEGLTQG